MKVIINFKHTKYNSVQFGLTITFGSHELTEA